MFFLLYFLMFFISVIFSSNNIAFLELLQKNSSYFNYIFKTSDDKKENLLKKTLEIYSKEFEKYMIYFPVHLLNSGLLEKKK